MITPLQAVQSIETETLLFLFGLMLLVGVATASGFFDYVNMQLAKKSGGDPKKVFLLFLLLITGASTMLNSPTLILLIVPIAIALAKGLNLDAKLLVILLVIFCNIGGSLTLIGDPPNTLIGVQAGLSFMQFLENLWFPVLSIVIVSFLYVFTVYRKSFPQTKDDLTKVFTNNLIIERIRYKYQEKTLDPYITIIAIIGVILTVGLLIAEPHISDVTGIEHGLVAFIGLAIGITASIMVMKKVTFHTVMKEVEWDSLLLFAALFIQVGALKEVGVMDIVTNQIMQFSDNIALMILVIVWGIGLASTVINTILFVAMMIPIITNIHSQLAGVPHIDLLWWALVLAACLGGNGTIIASSTGVIAVDLAKKQGINISFWEFMKVGMPLTILSLVMTSICLMGVYYLT